MTMPWGTNLISGNYYWHLDLSQTFPMSSAHIAAWTSDCQYLQSRGATLVRLPFMWERMQSSINGALVTQYLADLDNLISIAGSYGLKVLLDIHNYAIYRVRPWANNVSYSIGSHQLPISALANLWGKVASHYKGNPRIYGYGLMNEPNTLLGDSTTWFNACQVCINAIRAVDTITRIVVPGYQWNATVNWPSTSDNLKNLVDPRNNLIFEGHIYLDGTTLTQYNSEYTDPTCTNSMPDIGPQRLAPFVNWLRTNGKKGIIGEISVPIDQCWLDRFGTTLTALKAALDVIQGVIFWVMGEPWDASYNMSIEPTGGMDKPQTLMMMAAFNPVAHGIQILAGANHQDVTLVHV